MSELKFIVYDVQHGSCSHVITPANQHIIIDLGSKAETSICRYLKENYFRYGGTIDQLVLCIHNKVRWLDKIFFSSRRNMEHRYRQVFLLRGGKYGILT